MLAYGTAADAQDEYLQMLDDSVLLAMKVFGESIVSQFEDKYLIVPTNQDLKCIMTINAARRLPGCVGSIDCQH